MIEFACEHCGATVRVADQLAGRKGRCPGCEHIVLVPGDRPDMEHVLARQDAEDESSRTPAKTQSVKCPECGATLKVPADSAGEKARCAKCKTVFEIPDEGKKDSSGMIWPSEIDWYYLKDGEKIGPVSFDVMKQLATTGQLKPDDVLWYEGLDDWMPAAENAFIKDILPELAPSVPDSRLSELAGASQQPSSVFQQPLVAYPPAAIAPYPLSPQPSAPVEKANAPGAIAAMVCGIIGFVLCGVGLVLGIIAVALGTSARRRISRAPGRYGGGGMATAGIVLGILDIVFSALWLIFYIPSLSLVE